MNELIEKVIKWSTDCNILNPEDLPSQGLKLVSEYGELCNNMLEGRSTKDDVGDCIVVCINLAKIKGYNTLFLLNEHTGFFNGFTDISILKAGVALGKISDAVAKGSDYHSHLHDFVEKLRDIAWSNGHTIEECLEHAYNEIKDRKGIKFNGVFIKDTDPRYPEAKAIIDARKSNLSRADECV